MKESSKHQQQTDFNTTSKDGLTDITTACAFLHRSRASLYRDEKAGRIRFLKIGHSTRIRIRDLIKLAEGE